MSAPEEPYSLWHFIAPFLTAFFSWLIAWVTARRVAAKSTRKQAFVEILQILDSVEEATEELLLVAGDDANAHALFRAVCQRDRRLGRRMNEIFTAHPSKARLAGTDPVPPRVSRARIELRKIAAADELVSPGRLAFMGNSPKFVDLTERVERLRNELRSEAEDMHAGDLQP